jgi:hypothetical protein
MFVFKPCLPGTSECGSVGIVVPGGPTLRTRTWVAPFALANREDDYRTAWAFFENAGQGR